MNEKRNSGLMFRFAKFFIPFLLGVGVIAIVGFLLSESLRIKYFPLITGYFFPPLGKESIIPAGVVTGIDPLIMALSIAFVDIVVALFLVWNYDLAKKIPFVGKFIMKVEKVGEKSSNKYSWIKPLRFIGIVLFVMVPFQGSGGLVGFIVGRLIGMKSWNTFLAISTGSITVCLLIAYFADAILSVFVKNFLIGVMILIIVIMVIVMILIYKNSKKKKKQ